MVLRRMGNMAPRKQIKIMLCSAVGNIRMAKGIHATPGMGRRISMGGRMISSIKRDRPINNPSGTAVNRCETETDRDPANAVCDVSRRFGCLRKLHRRLRDRTGGRHMREVNDEVRFGFGGKFPKGDESSEGNEANDDPSQRSRGLHHLRVGLAGVAVFDVFDEQGVGGHGYSCRGVCANRLNTRRLLIFNGMASAPRRKPSVDPCLKSAGQGFDVRVTHALEIVRRERGAIPGTAICHDFCFRVRHPFFYLQFERSPREMGSIRNMSTQEFVSFAHIEEQSTALDRSGGLHQRRSL